MKRNIHSSHLVVLQYMWIWIGVRCSMRIIWMYCRRTSECVTRQYLPKNYVRLICWALWDTMKRQICKLLSVSIFFLLLPLLLLLLLLLVVSLEGLSFAFFFFAFNLFMLSSRAHKCHWHTTDSFSGVFRSENVSYVCVCVYVVWNARGSNKVGSWKGEETRARLNVSLHKLKELESMSNAWKLKKKN